MATTRQHRLALAGLVLAELAGVGLLHHLGGQPWAVVGWSDLDGWVATAAPVDALMAVLRVVALAVGWWLLATTALTAAAAAARADGLARWVRPLTLSVVRGAVDRCVAAGVSAALVVPAAPALAEPQPLPPPGLGEPAAVEPRQREPGRAEAGAGGPGGVEQATPGAGDAGAGGASDGQPPRAGDASGGGWRVHEVVAGEHLWRIAACHLAARRGVARGELAEDDVAAYWLEVVEVNADRLRSRDPDLIHPGERIRLPPV